MFVVFLLCYVDYVFCLLRLHHSCSILCYLLLLLCLIWRFLYATPSWFDLTSLVLGGLYIYVDRISCMRVLSLSPFSPCFCYFFYGFWLFVAITFLFRKILIPCYHFFLYFSMVTHLNIFYPRLSLCPFLYLHIIPC